jgi:hypothetical protein
MLVRNTRRIDLCSDKYENTRQIRAKIKIRLFTDAHAWFDECRSLNCTSEYECFLRRPDNDCFESQCRHTPDCVSGLSFDKITEDRVDRHGELMIQTIFSFIQKMNCSASIVAVGYVHGSKNAQCTLQACVTVTTAPSGDRVAHHQTHPAMTR